MNVKEPLHVCTNAPENGCVSLKLVLVHEEAGASTRDHSRWIDRLEDSVVLSLFIERFEKSLGFNSTDRQFMLIQ